MFFAPSKSKQRAKICIMVISKTSDHIQIKIKMPNPSQEPPESSNPQRRTYRTLMFFAPSKLRQRAKFWIMGVLKPVTISISRSIYQPLVRNLQHPPNPQMRTLRTWMFFAPSKSRQRAAIKNMGLSKISDHIPSQDQDGKPQSGTSSVLQIPK